MPDSRNKRASALLQGLPPAPDGLALDAGDRAQIARVYRGIVAGMIPELVEEAFTAPPRPDVFATRERGAVFGAPARPDAFGVTARGAAFAIPARREVFLVEDK